MFKIILLLTLPVFSAFAGNEVGNGGIGFKCADNSYLLLDFYEHEMLNPNSKIINVPEKKLKEILDERMAILSKLDEKTHQIYVSRLNSVIKDIKFLSEISLNKTRDSFEIAKPKNCKLEQFAIQRMNSQKQVEFFFDKEIWDALNPVAQAGLLLHEVIYEHFILLGEKNSINVRKYNAFIFSNEFEKASPQDYKKFVASLRVALY